MTNLERSGDLVEKLCCPTTFVALVWDAGSLVSIDGKKRFKLSPSGIPLFADTELSSDAEKQRDHYDEGFARKYAENLGYPHTREYTAYLDRAFLADVGTANLAESAELCCGQGELLQFEHLAVKAGIGVDISTAMLEIAREKHSANDNFLFVQGDVTKLPLGHSQFSSVFMFGGVHHVSDRRKLFSEVFRILKPGGRFYFREPVSDFFLWRWIRAVIYRVSPALDSETERPLLWKETVPLLQGAGFRLCSWRTYGFFGFCLFMNSDVLVFNRLFRFIPGIRWLARLSTVIDDLILRIPGLGRAGLQVVGVAEKPARGTS